GIFGRVHWVRRPSFASVQLKTRYPGIRGNTREYAEQDRFLFRVFPHKQLACSTWFQLGVPPKSCRFVFVAWLPCCSIWSLHAGRFGPNNSSRIFMMRCPS